MSKLLNKIFDAHIQEREFTPPEAKEPIKYRVLVLGIKIDGSDDTVELKISRDKSQILAAADSRKESFLDDAGEVDT